MLKKHMELSIALFALLSVSNVNGEENRMHNFAKDVGAFHDVLAPLWHAPIGTERSQNVCKQAGKLETLAMEIHNEETKSLLKSITDLKAQCKTTPSDIDTAFSQVHDAFHHLAEHKEH